MKTRISDIDPIIQKRYAEIIEYTPDEGNIDATLRTLQSKPYEPDVLHMVILMAGKNYDFTTVNYEFKCNLAIIGVQESSGTYKLAKSHPLVGFDGTWSATSDDPVISSKNFGELYVANVNFTVAHHLHTLKEMHFWKAFTGNLVVFHYVTILLENGSITCLNTRYIDKIRVEGCRFVNNVNGQSYAPGNLGTSTTATDPNADNPGGVLWIQGEFNEATIVNNEFYHTGRDEIVAIMSGNLSPDKVEFTRKNLTIANNTFTYGKNSYDVPNSKCLTLINDTSTNYVCTYIWENVYIGKNTFNFIAPCLNAIVIDTIENIIKFDNARIEGNVFNWESWQADARVTGIFHGGSTEPNYRIAPLIVEGNTFILKDSVSNAATGHYILRTNGTEMIVRNNTINATAYTSPTPTLYNGVLIKTDKLGGKLTFIGNRSEGLPSLGSLSESTTILDVSIDFIGNTLNYQSGFYCRNLSSFNLRIVNNMLSPEKFAMVSQGYGNTGSVWITDNVWNIISTNGKLEWRTFFSELSLATMNGKEMHLSSAVFTDNTIMGYAVMNDLGFPDSGSDVLVKERNIFPEYKFPTT